MLEQKLDCRREQSSPKRFDYVVAGTTVSRQFENYGVIPSDRPEALQAVGGMLSYLYETQKTQLDHLRVLQYLHQVLVYGAGPDGPAQPGADRDPSGAREKRGSLLWVLDRTKTAMGGRLLRSWLEKAPAEPGGDREAAGGGPGPGGRPGGPGGDHPLSEGRSPTWNGSSTAWSAAAPGGRDLVAWPGACVRFHGCGLCWSPLPAGLLRETCAQLTPLEELAALIDRAIVDEPPFSVREGGIIRAGYSEDVDRLRNVMTHGKEMVAEIETRTRETCGIKNIRIKYNKVFGYYIEVAKSQTDLVPADWVRKQTTVNAERYINQELKDLEHTILSAKDQITDLEYQLFAQVRQRCADLVETIQRTAAAVAQADVLTSLAAVAVSNHYCMPVVDEGIRSRSWTTATRWWKRC